MATWKHKLTKKQILLGMIAKQAKKGNSKAIQIMTKESMLVWTQERLDALNFYLDNRSFTDNFVKVPHVDAGIFLPRSSLNGAEKAKVLWHSLFPNGKYILLGCKFNDGVEVIWISNLNKEGMLIPLVNVSEW